MIKQINLFKKSLKYINFSKEEKKEIENFEKQLKQFINGENYEKNNLIYQIKIIKIHKMQQN